MRPGFPGMKKMMVGLALWLSEIADDGGGGMWRKELGEMEDFNKGLVVDIVLKREIANWY
jgi:hypothetical protein